VSKGTDDDDGAVELSLLAHWRHWQVKSWLAPCSWTMDYGGTFSLAEDLQASRFEDF
jgi:hypothetical protein